MTLRTRLALPILLTAVPLAAGLVWLDRDLDRRARLRGLAEFATGLMRAGGRPACEMDPAVFPRIPRLFGPGGPPRAPGGPPGRGPPPRGGPRPPPALPEDVFELWAYGADFASANPEAPPLPADFQRALEEGRRVAGVRLEHGGRPSLRGAVRMPWQGTPCDVVLIGRHLPEAEAGGGLLLPGLAALCGSALLAVLLAAGPIVRRIRALQRDVERAAAAQYAAGVDVEGGDEIADLASAFNAAGARIRQHVGEVEERERALRAFVANTTHDVMIPLTVLQGHLTALGRAARNGAPAEEAVVGDALEESHYLGSLLSNLAAVAKLEASEQDLARDDVDLNRLVERVIARHAPIARAKGVELAHAVPEAAVVCRGDVTLLEQAVSNLVHNAVRYGRGGGHASVALEAQGGRFVVRVLDDGPGVDDALLSRLTERRFRTEAARTRHPDGKGLGLAIARDVAERHGFALAFRRLDEGGLEATLSGPA